VIYSSMLPGAPIKTTAADWQDICRSWEVEKGITPEQKHAMMMSRMNQIDGMQTSPRSGGFSPEAPPPGPDPNEGLLAQQRAELSVQQSQLAEMRARLDAAQRQESDVRRRLAETQMQADAVQRRQASAQDDLERARAEAERNRAEVEELRNSHAQMQRGWETEKQTLEGRVASMEASLGELQSEVVRRREEHAAELLSRDRELASVKQSTEVAALRKELQLRELLQEEVSKVRDEAHREAEERARQEQIQRTQQELDEMKKMLREHPLPSVCAPVSPPRSYAPPGPVVPQGAGYVQTRQRTVATQTPPAGFQSGQPQPYAGPGPQITVQTAPQTWQPGRTYSSQAPGSLTPQYPQADRPAIPTPTTEWGGSRPPPGYWPRNQ